MGDLIVAIIIIGIVAGAIIKIIKEKQKGAKCIGCPYSQNGGSNCSCNHFRENSEVYYK